MVPLPVNVFCFPAPASTPRLKPNPMSRSKKGSRVPGRPDDGYHLYIRERVMADKGLSMTVQTRRHQEGHAAQKKSLRP